MKIEEIGGWGLTVFYDDNKEWISKAFKSIWKKVWVFEDRGG